MQEFEVLFKGPKDSFYEDVSPLNQKGKGNYINHFDQNLDDSSSEMSSPNHGVSVTARLWGLIGSIFDSVTGVVV